MQAYLTGAAYEVCHVTLLRTQYPSAVTKTKCTDQTICNCSSFLTEGRTKKLRSLKFRSTICLKLNYVIVAYGYFILQAHERLEDSKLEAVSDNNLELVNEILEDISPLINKDENIAELVGILKEPHFQVPPSYSFSLYTTDNIAVHIWILV